MRVGAGAVQRQQQTPGMVPEHLMGKSMLKMSLQELHQFVQAQIAENPALTLEEDSRCPVCGCSLVGDFCATCGSESLLNSDDPNEPEDDWQDGLWTSPGHADDEYLEPFSRVAAPSSLAEHLKAQIRLLATDDELRIAEFLIDCIDEDCYLREPLVDIATRFKVSVPQLEKVLLLVQSLDPAGVAARDLRECLLIQIMRHEDESPDKALAEAILRDHWDGLSRMKLDRIASQLSTDSEAVAGALSFIRENLTPHPAGGFRDPWAGLAPRRESKHAPDVRVRRTEVGLVPEMLDSISGRINVDEAYDSLYNEILKKRNGCSESDLAHVRECVQTARMLIDALEFRKGTIQRVAEELVRSQSEFIIGGPAFLKPMTRKELARTLGVHESTVCRATSDKTMQLPSGEVVPFEIFFDSALPVKELVRQMSSERKNGRALSDGEIAQRLNDLGICIARRTVAKYRSQLRVPSIDYRAPVDA